MPMPSPMLEEVEAVVFEGRIKKAISESVPPADMVERVWKNLMQEWGKRRNKPRSLQSVIGDIFNPG